MLALPRRLFAPSAELRARKAWIIELWAPTDPSTSPSGWSSASERAQRSPPLGGIELGSTSPATAATATYAYGVGAVALSVWIATTLQHAPTQGVGCGANVEAGALDASSRLALLGPSQAAVAALGGTQEGAPSRPCRRSQSNRK